MRSKDFVSEVYRNIELHVYDWWDNSTFMIELGIGTVFKVGNDCYLLRPVKFGLVSILEDDLNKGYG